MVDAIPGRSQDIVVISWSPGVTVKAFWLAILTTIWLVPMGCGPDDEFKPGYGDDDDDDQLDDDVTPDDDDSLVPPSIAGYQITAELSRGGQGVVYQAIQEYTKRQVAIKVLLAGAHTSKMARRRFER